MMLKLESEFETRTKSSEETLQQSPSLKGQLELFTGGIFVDWYFVSRTWLGLDENSAYKLADSASW